MNQDYIRQTFVALDVLTNEGSNLDPNDFIGDDIGVKVRKAMFDTVLADSLNAEMKKIIKAFELADLQPQQAAKVLYILNTTQGKN